ncbi:hypothetical protein TWF506_007811 [Arthrobotrys conoides]|uniref:Uncharacterized protein n=1 Tax=Arthrobotrys conoides TaxID=74498 RepID=A0AAN8NQG9_9PEZI
MPNSDLEAMKGAWKSGEVGAKIGEVMRKLWDQISNFENAKSLYPRKLIAQLAEEYPGYNVAVFHNQYSGYYFVNGAHSHHECKGGLFGTTFGYEAWVFECGYLQRYGDAGWENWACHGWLCSPGSEDHVLFTNGSESPQTFWDEGMTHGRPQLDFIKKHCNEMTTTYPSGGWWDSHEYGSYAKGSGSLPPIEPPKKDPSIVDIDLDDIDLENHPKHPWDIGRLAALPPRTTVPLE